MLPDALVALSWLGLLGWGRWVGGPGTRGVFVCDRLIICARSAHLLSNFVKAEQPLCIRFCNILHEKLSLSATIRHTPSQSIFIEWNPKKHSPFVTGNVPRRKVLSLPPTPTPATQKPIFTHCKYDCSSVPFGVAVVNGGVSCKSQPISRKAKALCFTGFRQKWRCSNWFIIHGAGITEKIVHL